MSASPPANEDSPLHVLAHLIQRGASLELAARIEKALSAAGMRVVAAHDLSPAGRVDVIVSDSAEALAELGLAENDAANRPGVVFIGRSPAGGDAELPTDFTDRELTLACRLVGEIVRLRRRSLDVERQGEEFARLAGADPLTGLANRRTWDREAAERLARARAAGHAVCLAVFDVDRFKRVNDEQGYAAGDAVLAGLGRELAAALRSGDLLARLGGDEFAALLVGQFDGPSALAIVDRVRSAVGEHESARLGFDVSLSAGCAVMAAGELAKADLAELFAAADAALRQAKRKGRNRAALAG
ncbi:MAG TPA: GGDEF domain-containing protein [Pirellulales bacterium]|nr:GGDEF domain-containing protein [Pirellulales bacterium]